MAKEKHLLDTNNNLHRDPITGEPGSHPVAPCSAAWAARPLPNA